MNNEDSNNTALHRINGEVKRRRGRPKGSKNKPKSKATIAGHSIAKAKHCCSFHPHVMEIPDGSDVAGAITSFARSHSGGGVCVLSASGSIAEACICLSSSSDPMLLRDTCQLLSITASFLPGRGESMMACFGGPLGQIICGRLVGPLVAAGMVVVVVATFGTSEPVEEGNFSGRSSDVLAVARAAEGQTPRLNSNLTMEAADWAVANGGRGES